MVLAADSAARLHSPSVCWPRLASRSLQKPLHKMLRLNQPRLLSQPGLASQRRGRALAPRASMRAGDNDGKRNVSLHVHVPAALPPVATLAAARRSNSTAQVLPKQAPAAFQTPPPYSRPCCCGCRFLPSATTPHLSGVTPRPSAAACRRLRRRWRSHRLPRTPFAHPAAASTAPTA